MITPTRIIIHKINFQFFFFRFSKLIFKGLFKHIDLFFSVVACSMLSVTDVH